MHLWSRLDGKDAENPVARIPRYKEPDPEPCGLSWEERGPNSWRYAGTRTTGRGPDP